MHEANHPWTRHYKTDVRELDPIVVTRNKRVGLAWFSPDCTFFSKSRGGKPMRGKGKTVRGLSWVVINWARKVRPRVIILENVEEFQEWGPVVKKLDPKGRPVLDESGNPWFVPCVNRKGKTFQKWVRRAEQLGYRVEWKELRGCDYGDPTIRKRLFIILRCDNEPIVWPAATHGKPGSADVVSGKKLPWRAAADIIDWSLPCHSIFLTTAEGRAVGVNRPLKENTMKRIFAGLKRYVLECAKPFVVYANHGGDWFRGYGADDPCNTVTCSRDAVGVVDPLLAPYVASPAHSTTTGRGKNHWGPDEPLPTQTTSNDKCVVLPVMTYGQHGGANRSAEEPMHTVTTSDGDQNAIVVPVLDSQYGNSQGVSVGDPHPTVMAGGGGKSALISPVLGSTSHTKGNGAYVSSLTEPAKTVTTGVEQCVIAPILDSCYGNRPDGSMSKAAGCDEPLKAVLAGGKHHALVTPILDAYHGPKGDVVGRSGELSEPLRTQDTSNRHALVNAFIAQHNTGMVGHSPGLPLSTITNTGAQQQIVNAFVAQHNTGSVANSAGLPLTTITNRGTQQQVVAASMITNTSGHGPGDPNGPVATVTTGQQQGIAAAFMSHHYTSNTGGGQGNPDKPAKTVTASGGHHSAVLAFLQKYYGTGGQHSACDDPLHTASTKARFGVVTVNEMEYQIVDIGMRMLTARELFSAQGFPRDYKIDVWCDDRRNKDGKPMKPGYLTKQAQVRCAGNSVCPGVATALVAANCAWLKVDPATWPKERPRELGEYWVRQPKARARGKAAV